MRAISPFFVTIVTACAAVGFVGMTVWTENRKLDELREDVGLMKPVLADTQKGLSEQSEKILIREISIRSLSQDLVDQREMIKQLELQMSAVKESVDKKSGGDEALQTKLDESLKVLTTQLQGATQRLREMELMEGQHTVRINALQQRLVSIDSQILMIREQFLMKPQPSEEPVQRALPPSITIPPVQSAPAPQRPPSAG